MITLSGGPYNGQTLTYVEGDILTMRPIPGEIPAVLDFSVPTGERVRFTRHLYRRSLQNPDIFVFQP